MNNKPSLTGDQAQDEAIPQIDGRWSALREAASTVGIIAGAPLEKPDPRSHSLPTLIRDVEPWRRELALNQIDDIDAMLQPGLTALLAVSARGLDAKTPARALWNEYRSARESLLALLPETDALRSQPSA